MSPGHLSGTLMALFRHPRCTHWCPSPPDHTSVDSTQMEQPLYCEASTLGYPKGKVPRGPDAPPAVKSPVPCPWIPAPPLTHLCPHSLHQKTHLLKPPTPKPAWLSEFREDHFILPEPQVADNSGIYSVTDKPIPSTPAPTSPLPTGDHTDLLPCISFIYT